MMSTKNSFLLIPMVVFACSCEYIESINMEGDMVTKQVQLQPFNSIFVEAPYRITLVQDSDFFVDFKGMDYLVEGAIIEQVDQVIYLKHEFPNRIQKSKLIELKIHANHLQSITVNSAGQMSTLDTLRTSDLSVVINGGGTYFETNLNIDVQSFSLTIFGRINTSSQIIKGIAEKGQFWIEGCTYVYADSLICQEVDFTHKSAANCFVTALSSLNAIVYSGGNLYYHGDPDIEFTLGQSATLNASGLLIPIKN